MKTSIFALMMANFILVTTIAGQDFRTWTSLNGDHKISAQFLDYDTRTRQVELVTEQDKTISVEIYKLSTADQRFVKRVARKRANSELPKLAADKSDGTAAENSNRRNKRKTAGQNKRKFGIHWTLDLDNALKVAAGGPSPGDDRPVMWLRVLGELEGFM